MEKINAVIVDDELNARENLQYLLGEFCKQVTIVAQASNVDDAVVAINKHKPHLVFLDIEMPRKNGFQLLEEFLEINVQIIFVTAYDAYAIKAFEVSAIDYLLKPIDISRLKESVIKAQKSIENSSVSNEKLSVLKENKKGLKKIAIPYKTDYVILNVEDVLCIEADRMYSVLHTVKNKKYLVAKKLSYYEGVLCDDTNFIRLHRSWIVNLNKVNRYSKRDKEVILETEFKVPVSKSNKENFETLFYS